MADRKTHAERIFDHNIMRSVERQWGRGFDSLGASFQRAIVAEQMLVVVSLQDDEIAASSIVSLIDDLRSILDSRFPG